MPKAARAPGARRRCRRSTGVPSTRNTLGRSSAVPASVARGVPRHLGSRAWPDAASAPRASCRSRAAGRNRDRTIRDVTTSLAMATSWLTVATVARMTRRLGWSLERRPLSSALLRPPTGWDHGFYRDERRPSVGRHAYVLRTVARSAPECPNSPIGDGGAVRGRRMYLWSGRP